jgi:hypothetical protein
MWGMITTKLSGEEAAAPMAVEHHTAPLAQVLSTDQETGYT